MLLCEELGGLLDPGVTQQSLEVAFYKLFTQLTNALQNQ